MIAKLWTILFGAALLVLSISWLLQLNLQCTPEAPPGPAIAGIIRIGGCP